MKIWIYLDGRQQGPFDFAQMPIDRMDPETPVWYEGLRNWMPAGQAPATAELFADYRHQQAHTGEPAPEVHVETQPAEEQYVPIDEQPAPEGQWQQRQRWTAGSYAANQPQEPCPPSYLVWSILLTVLCCNPVGIVAVVLGLNVGSKYRNYNYEGARKTSECTAWWLMITIVTSLMSLPLTMLSWM